MLDKLLPQKRTEQQLFDLMDAFYLYKKEGMEAVREYYPRCLEFVEQNRDRSYQEVKAELVREIRSL